MDKNSTLLMLAELYTGRRGVSPYLLLATGVATVALLTAGIYLWNTLRRPGRRKEEATAESLFAELCKSHRLIESDRQLIGQVVRAYNVSQPCAIFIDPATLDRAAAAADVDAPRYANLRQKLFGGLS